MSGSGAAIGMVTMLKKSAVTDPTGPTNGVERVLRGSSWINSWNVGNHGAYRRRTYPDIKDNNYGFRCVSTAPGP